MNYIEVCLVYPIQVSSFSTNLEKGKKIDFDLVNGTEGWDENDFSRWENSLRRDFTINGYIHVHLQCYLLISMLWMC